MAATYIGRSGFAGLPRAGSFCEAQSQLQGPSFLRYSTKCPQRLSSSAKDAAPQNGDSDESQGSDDFFREQLENIIDSDDSVFTGKELAMLIRKKYGRSYDVQLLKKEFMGRQLLAMNVMWKYREQKSFPLSEEEYMLHLDDIANSLRCWGAVSYVKNSLAKTKERPRIGKAVSILIDMDESGGRANEWIYK